MTTNASSSTTSQWLNKAISTLKAVGVATARLDALVLLEDGLGKDRTHLLAHPDIELTNEQLSVLNSCVSRRAAHEPLAYIRGKTEFYGRKFLVNSHTLEPRPETETMIDLFKSLKLPGFTLVDIGTGSGAIGITAALEQPVSQLILIDIDQNCLEVADQNTKLHSVKADLIKGDLLEPVKNYEASTKLILLANLPYVPDSHTINQAAMQEPKHAIFGGPDGLDLYRRMFNQVLTLPAKPRWILTESLPFQHEELMKIAAAAGYQQQAEEDFIQVFTAERPR